MKKSQKPPLDTVLLAPTIETVIGGADFVSDEDLTNQSNLVLSGHADVVGTVELSDGGEKLGTATVNKAGFWTFNTGKLENGDHVFRAKAVGEAGGAGADSDAYTVTIDAEQPDPPSIKSVIDDIRPIAGAVDENDATDDFAPVLRGRAEPGSMVEVFDHDLSLGWAITDDNGLWIFDAPTLDAGRHAFRAKATDEAHNTSVASAAYPVMIDTAAPSVTITSDTTRFKAGDTATVAFTFSEIPLGFTADDIAVAGGKLSGLTVDPDNAKAYTALFTPTTAIDAWSGSIGVAAGTFTDAVGNAGAAGNRLALSGDTQGPSVAIGSDKPRLNAGDTAAVTFTFSEVPSGFSADDIDVTGGRLSGLSASSADGTVYAATFTSSATFLSGSIGVPGKSYTDLAGNVGAAGNTVKLSVDTQPPSLAITSDKTGFRAGETATVTFTFSKPPHGFATDDIAVTGGKLNGLAVDPGNAKVYTAVFTPTAAINALSGSIKVAAGIYTDTAGNPGAAGNMLALSGDTLAPSVTIKSDKPRLLFNETATITLTFSEVPSDYYVRPWATGGDLSFLRADPLDARVYTTVFTPVRTDALAATIGITGSSYSDGAGNAGTGAMLSLVGDTQYPSVDIKLDKTGFRAGETAKVTFKFSEVPFGFNADDINVPYNSGLSGLAVDPGDTRVYTALFTPAFATTDFQGRIQVKRTSYTDAAGNYGISGSSPALTGDTLSPWLEIGVDQARPIKAGDTSTVIFRFNTPPKGFTADDIAVTGGQLSRLAVSPGDNKVYTALFTPAGKVDNWSGTVSVAAGTYTDGAGHAGSAATTLKLSGDTLAPSVVIGSDKTRVNAGETATVTFAFSEVPSGFSVDDIAVSGGRLSGLAANPTDGKVYTATFTPASTNLLSGSIGVTAKSYTDLAGNVGKSSGNTLALNGDTLAPSVTLKSDKTGLRAGETATVTFTFSETPQGFTADDIGATSGTVSGLAVDPGDAKVYTARFTPIATSTLFATLGVQAGTYSDAAGNAGGASYMLRINGDTLGPSLVIESDKTRFKAGDGATITFTFSEAPRGFTDADITVSGGSLSGLSASPGDSKIYTAQFTPSVDANNLSGAIGVAAGVYTDAAGNAGSAGNALALSGDTLAPGVAISSDQSRFKAGETATVTFAFSEVPSGFTADDIAVTGGQLSDLLANPFNGAVYTAKFTPAANTDNLSGSIGVAAGAYSDAAGNGGTAGNALALSCDTLAPSLAIGSEQTRFKAGDSAVVTFAFSEVPQGFTDADITVSGGSLSGLSASPGDGRIYTARFTPSVDTNNLSGAIGVAAGGYTDAAGNAGSAGDALALSGDTLAPSVLFGSDKSRFKAGETATVTFTFSEVPSGFTADDIAVSGGQLSGLTASPVNGAVYTAKFTPAANTDNLNGSIGVVAGAYSDAAGNAGTAGKTLPLIVDTLAPSLAISSDPNPLKAGETPVVTFAFSEAPRGFTAEDVGVTGGSLSGFAVDPDDGKVYTATFTPAANTDNLSGSIGVAAGVYTDAVGNAGTAGNTLALTGDTLAPSLAIGSDRTVFSSGDTATVTFSFSEVPGDFTAGDVIVTGGSLSELTVNPSDGKSYTAVFTPTSGIVNQSGSIDVAAGAYTDAAGNPGAGNSLSLTISTYVSVQPVDNGSQTTSSDNNGFQQPPPSNNNGFQQPLPSNNSGFQLFSQSITLVGLAVHDEF